MDQLGILSQKLADAESLNAVLRKANSDQANVIAELTSLRSAEVEYVEDVAMGLCASRVDMLRDDRCWVDVTRQ